MMTEQLRSADLIFTALPGCRYEVAVVSYLLVVKIQQVLDVLGAELDLPHIIVKQLSTFFQLLPDHLKNKSQYNTIRPRAFKTIFYPTNLSIIFKQFRTCKNNRSA